MNLKAFLLTRSWRDTLNGLEIEYWAASESGPIRLVITGEKAVFGVPRGTELNAGQQSPTDFRALGGTHVDVVCFPTQKEMVSVRDDLRRREVALYESDLRPSERYLMKHGITGPCSLEGPAVEKTKFMEFTNPTVTPTDYTPKLKLAAVDIETNAHTNQLLSIAATDGGHEHVWVLGERDSREEVSFLPYERDLIKAFLEWVEEHDPDLVVGWNVIDFDLALLEQKCRRFNLPFALGRDGGCARIHRGRTRRQSSRAFVSGRVIVDGISALKMAMYHFESFALEAVAQELLGKGKLLPKADRVDEIIAPHKANPLQLAGYNLEDCRLVLDIFEAADLVAFLLERAKMTGLAMDHVNGSVAAFTNLYIPRLHRHGYVAPDHDPDKPAEASPGGYVMDSRPGLYENVLVLDYKSLYPSIIRTFHIDPLALSVPGQDPIPGFNGAAFSRDTHILPGMIETLWEARAKARQAGNKPLAQAIKILMNSFYGVLGTPACRFFDPRLAGSITRYGQWIIKQTREFIEHEGFDVIYGDTDSVFVLLGPGFDEETASRTGDVLAAKLNAWWRDKLRFEYGIDSFFEVEYETHYLRFLMPTVRGSREGSKKRYAGLVRGKDGTLTTVFKGLESVRTDWTPLAREFQQELYRRVFCDEPYESYIRDTVQAVNNGKVDHKLVYRKQLRKPIREYQKNVPPHAQAARQLDKPGQWIRYIITVNGPEPVEKLRSAPDYDHYLQRQLAPVADSILHFLGTDFETVVSRQMELF